MIKKITIYIIVATFFISPILVLAQATGTGSPGANAPTNTSVPINIPNPTNAGDDIMDIIGALLQNVVMPVAAVAVVMWIIWAGFSYLTAQGNPAKIETAHKRLLWSLIGAGVLLGAAGISAVVKNTISALLVP